MSAESTVVGIVVGVAVGIASTVLVNKLQREILDLEYKDKIEDASRHAFRDGWNAASNSVTNVCRRYQDLMDSKSEKDGIAFKG